MFLVKKILLAVLLLTGVAAGGYVYLNKYQPDMVLGSDVPKMIEDKVPLAGKVLGQFAEKNEDGKIGSVDVNQALDLTSSQLEILKDRSVEVKDQVTKAVSEIKENENSTPLHEKAFEYGQYLYCQQVIEEYEAQQ